MLLHLHYNFRICTNPLTLPNKAISLKTLIARMHITGTNTT